MSKFVKRISKVLEIEGNALVVGDGFGFLNEIIPMFPSVFVILNSNDRIKSKNIIYRSNIDDIHVLPEIKFVFVDRKFESKLDMFENLIIKHRPYFLIEGNDWVLREHTKKLFHFGYKGITRQGYFHIWKEIK